MGGLPYRISIECFLDCELVGIKGEWEESILRIKVSLTASTKHIHMKQGIRAVLFPQTSGTSLMEITF